MALPRLPINKLRELRRWLPASRRDWLMILAGGMAGLALAGIIMLINNKAQPTPPEGRGDTGLNDVAWLPDTVLRWEDGINEMAERYSLDPALLAIIMTLESGGYSRAVSPADAQGLMQVTPPTAGDIAQRHLKEPRENYDLSDPRTNIEFGAAYLAMLRDKFDEQRQSPPQDKTVELIAAGYNGGPGAAGRLYRGEGLTNQETVSYSRDAVNMWRERNADESPTFNRWLERGGQRLIDLAQDERL